MFNLKLLPSLRARRMRNAAHLSPQQLYSLPRCARRVFITPRFFKHGGNEYQCGIFCFFVRTVRENAVFMRFYECDKYFVLFSLRCFQNMASGAAFRNLIYNKSGAVLLSSANGFRCGS